MQIFLVLFFNFKNKVVFVWLIKIFYLYLYHELFKTTIH